MPYRIKRNRKTGLWEIIKKATGKVVGTSTSKAKAKASIWHREHGDKK